VAQISQTNSDNTERVDWAKALGADGSGARRLADTAGRGRSAGRERSMDREAMIANRRVKDFHILIIVLQNKH
jgi:hypothetical protein